MSPTTTNAEIAKHMQDLQARLAMVETVQKNLESDLGQLKAMPDTIRTGYATKDELRYQLENLRLTIDALKNQVIDLAGRLGGLETNIVKKVEDIGKQQQEAQTSSMKRIITVQGAVLLSIVATVLGVVIPLLFHK